MKKRISLVCVLMLAVSLLAGCGSGSGGSGEKKSKEPEPFTLGEYTYKLGPIARNTEEDTDSEEAYTVTLLIEGDSAPVIISGGVTKAGVEVTLVSGDDTYNYTVAGFKALTEEEKEGEFGASAEFTFKIPKGTDFPEKAIVNDGSNPEEKTELDLSGVEIKE